MLLNNAKAWLAGFFSGQNVTIKNINNDTDTIISADNIKSAISGYGGIYIGSSNVAESAEQHYLIEEIDTSLYTTTPVTKAYKTSYNDNLGYMMCISTTVTNISNSNLTINEVILTGWWSNPSMWASFIREVLPQTITLGPGESTTITLTLE